MTVAITAASITITTKEKIKENLKESEEEKEKRI
jgi:hypothetical protein